MNTSEFIKILNETEAELSKPRKKSRTRREPSFGEIGGVIQQIREAQSMSLRELARRAETNVNQIHYTESSFDSNPTFLTLRKIAKALGKPLSVIVRIWETEVDSMNKKP